MGEAPTIATLDTVLLVGWWCFAAGCLVGLLVPGQINWLLFSERTPQKGCSKPIEPRGEAPFDE